MANFLIVQRGPEIGRRYNLDKPVTTVGRSEDNDLSFDDPYMSRYHAVIKQQAGDLVLIDLGSENPVLIRDAPLDPGDPYILQNRDILRFGQNVLVFIDSSQTPPRPQPAANSTRAVDFPSSGTGNLSSPAANSGGDAIAPGSFSPSWQMGQPQEVIQVSPPVEVDVPVEVNIPNKNLVDGDKPTGPVVNPDIKTQSEATIIDFSGAAPYSSTSPASSVSGAESQPSLFDRSGQTEDESNERTVISGFNGFPYGQPVSVNPDQPGTFSQNKSVDEVNLNAPPSYTSGQQYAQGQQAPIQNNDQAHQYNQPNYEPNQQYGQAPQYGQVQYPPQPYTPYNQEQGYGQGQYQYGQPGQAPAYNPYAQYGQNPYSQYGQGPVDENEGEATRIASYDPHNSSNPYGVKNPVEPVDPKHSKVPPPNFDEGDAPTTVIKIDKNK